MPAVCKRNRACEYDKRIVFDLKDFAAYATQKTIQARTQEKEFLLSKKVKHSISISIFVSYDTFFQSCRKYVYGMFT